jgi:hypothetical protein
MKLNKEEVRKKIRKIDKTNTSIKQNKKIKG